MNQGISKQFCIKATKHNTNTTIFDGVDKWSCKKVHSIDDGISILKMYVQEIMVSHPKSGLGSPMFDLLRF